jgi:serine protease Do
MKKLIELAAVSMLSGIAGALVTYHLLLTDPRAQAHTVGFSGPEVFSSSQPVMPEASADGVDDFVLASARSTSSVVFIQTTSAVEYASGGWLDWFFEPRNSQRTSSGSGVIFSADGYIVTNNHVIDKATEIRVIAGKRDYKAELVGRDPSTDLAVIKIDAPDLPAITLGNSDEVRVGEWVLAVGNPFNLTSTVTAGIVSAKGRNLNLLRDKFPIESFIQTDAAINPGNSGGALVNARGELIGINTAILSRTGSYTGYGFAVPINIVKKVFNDITRYGEVQKAYLGADYQDLNRELAQKFKLDDLNGVILSHVQEGSAAEQAGLKIGDVLRTVDNIPVDNRATIEEVIANKYPGDDIQVQLLRDGKTLTKTVKLTNREGGTGILKRVIYTSPKMNASFETVSKVERDLYGIRAGVKVIAVQRGGFFSQLNIPEGFIITQVNDAEIKQPDQLTDLLERLSGRVKIYGIDLNGRKVYYAFYF